MEMESFGNWLRELRGGTTDAELAEELQDLVRQVELTGKAGVLTLAVKVKPQQRGTVLVDTEVKSKPPVPLQEDTLFFVTETGGLTRRDPRQLALPALRIVGERAANGEDE